VKADCDAWNVRSLADEPIVALLASGQISMRKVDGWRTLARTSIGQPIDLAA
jgi:hypothetical protein